MKTNEGFEEQTSWGKLCPKSQDHIEEEKHLKNEENWKNPPGAHTPCIATP
jgi:hypothetical protein